MPDPVETEVIDSGPRREYHAQPRLADSEVERLVEMRQAGESIEELAAYFGIYRTTVMAHLRRAGVLRVRDAKRWTEATLQFEAGRYRAGDTLAMIAARQGVSPNTVGRRLVAAGVQLRPRGLPLRSRRR